MLMRIVLPALALAATAAPAFAAPASIAVPYGDLDLTKEAGQKTLDIRLARAARQLCGGVTSARDLQRMSAYRACLAEARASWGEQVELALDNANARRVAVLADKIMLFTRF